MAAAAAPASADADAKMVVVVTGGTGLWGTALQAFVAENDKENEQWHFLSSKDADLKDFEATKAVFERLRPTHVVHLAARVGGLFANLKYPVDFLRDNLRINDNVMECSRLVGAKKCVSALSTCIFPDKTSYPIDETMLHDGPPHTSNAGYALAKRLLDTANHAYNKQYPDDTFFTSVIPTNIYGIGDNYSIEHGHVVPGLLHKAYLAKRDGTPLPLWGTGSPLRQFIASSDLAKLTYWVLKEYKETEPIILAPDEADEVSIADVADLVADAMGLPRDRIEKDATKSDGQYKKTASNAKLRRYLPDFKFTPMAEGMKVAADWFVANYETARK